MTRNVAMWIIVGTTTPASSSALGETTYTPLVDSGASSTRAAAE